MENTELFGHPKGLFVLFFTELWERFSYYGMRAILVLYMISKSSDLNAGLGWSESYALGIYGWYTMAVYMASIPGGIIADRWIGQKKAVFVGGLLLCAGHSVLAIDTLWAFFTGITLSVLGSGGLKPNISTMVGALYKEKDPRRDAGFTIFYVGINIGAFMASLLVGFIGETYGWHYGFGLAGFGMMIGQLVYFLGRKHLAGIGEPRVVNREKGARSREPLTKVEKDRIIVLLLASLIIIFFFVAFEQAGGLMNIYAKQKIDRMVLGYEIPASMLQALNPLFVMLLGGVVASYWIRRQKDKKETSALFKMAIGTMIMGFGFLLMAGAALETRSSVSGQAAIYWLVGCYLLSTIGELCASPVSLSFVTKLAPARYASLMMGLYFAAIGFGAKLAGVIGSMTENAGEFQIFIGIFTTSVSLGLLVLLFLRRFNALTHGAEEQFLVPEASSLTGNVVNA